MHGPEVLRCGRQVGVSHQAHEHARIISLDGAGEIVAHILRAKLDARFDVARSAGKAPDAFVHFD